ncbi:uncharacterized protein J8A68_002341 [[Candida] subhashii]|uniref:Uncharacterized protein n=1 Tax=[Candida] subhashii TaxID=561895 RepID=A0A8J5UJ38_9ASCO|nr:uncharacterized protein J8A68_002341 [[Candida] subhashii]KAG7664158.1 hypothetical protein J8A68_002341 [[Candida] subhashii]
MMMTMSRGFNHTFPTRQNKYLIHYRYSKTPLCEKNPPDRGGDISQYCPLDDLDPVLGLFDYEDVEDGYEHRGPKPAFFDKPLI